MSPQIGELAAAASSAGVASCSAGPSAGRATVLPQHIRWAQQLIHQEQDNGVLNSASDEQSSNGELNFLGPRRTIARILAHWQAEGISPWIEENMSARMEIDGAIMTLFHHHQPLEYCIGCYSPFDNDLDGDHAIRFSHFESNFLLKSNRVEQMTDWRDFPSIRDDTKETSRTRCPITKSDNMGAFLFCHSCEQVMSGKEQKMAGPSKNKRDKKIFHPELSLLQILEYLRGDDNDTAMAQEIWAREAFDRPCDQLSGCLWSNVMRLLFVRMAYVYHKAGYNSLFLQYRALFDAARTAVFPRPPTRKSTSKEITLASRAVKTSLYLYAIPVHGDAVAQLALELFDNLGVIAGTSSWREVIFRRSEHDASILVPTFLWFNNPLVVLCSREQIRIPDLEHHLIDWTCEPPKHHTFRIIRHIDKSTPLGAFLHKHLTASLQGTLNQNSIYGNPNHEHFSHLFTREQKVKFEKNRDALRKRFYIRIRTGQNIIKKSEQCIPRRLRHMMWHSALVMAACADEFQRQICLRSVYLPKQHMHEWFEACSARNLQLKLRDEQRLRNCTCASELAEYEPIYRAVPPGCQTVAYQVLFFARSCITQRPDVYASHINHSGGLNLPRRRWIRPAVSQPNGADRHSNSATSQERNDRPKFHSSPPSWPVLIVLRPKQSRSVRAPHRRSFLLRSSRAIKTQRNRKRATQRNRRKNSLYSR